MKKKKLAIVFDWDDLVLNTAVIKNKIADSLVARGLSRELIMKTVAVAKDSKGYHPLIHGRMIVKEVGDIAGSAKDIASLIHKHHDENARKLLFPDAIRIIRVIHKAGYPLYVLSAGHPVVQNPKIKNSGLAHYFKKIYIVSVTGHDSAGATKAKVLLDIARRHGQAVFLDDKPKTIETIQQMEKLNGKILPVLVWRKKEKAPKGLLAVRSLSWEGLKKIAIQAGFRP